MKGVSFERGLSGGCLAETPGRQAKERRHADEIPRTASAYFAMAEPNRRERERCRSWTAIARIWVSNRSAVNRPARFATGRVGTGINCVYLPGLISTLRVAATISGFFGKVTVSTPLAKLAPTFSASAPSGRENDRSKLPNARSVR